MACSSVWRQIAAVQRRSISFGPGVVIRFPLAVLTKSNEQANEVSHLTVCGTE